MSFTRLPLALGAFFVLAIGVVFSGCGESVPGNGVAKVSDAPGDGVVTTEDFNHWMSIAANRSGQTPGSDPIPVPDPPNYTKCIANKKKTAPKPAKGQPTTTDAQYKAQCKQEWEGLRDQVLGFLIAAQWVKGEAEEQDIKVTKADIDKAFAEQKKQAFPKDADYKKFLKESGSTEEDIRFQLEVEQLQQKLVAKITKGKDKVSNQQIADYYNKNKAQFATPESRDLLVILTKTKEQADRAKAALEGGESWAAVAKRYSIDEASKDQGGKLAGVTKGQQEKALDDAVFAAKKDTTIGPIKTQFGYYVARVTKITAKDQQSVKEATPTIKSLLASQNQQKSLDTFVKEYRERWKERTNCREGYVIQDCKNAKAPNTNTATTPAQGGAQQPGGEQPQPTPAAPPGAQTTPR
ncbi:MAG: peptidyl-prolyl cis-trans isomerase [Solirubrobacteraceae bacterium]|nr:peptidyl-prolyl cis-trans isomerase [Solirubrobacteraceae bacterium]